MSGPVAGSISSAGNQKSFSDLQTKFGGSNPISLGEYSTLIDKDSTDQIDIDDYAGVSGVIMGTTPNPGNTSFTGIGSSSGTALGGVAIGFAYQPGESRVRFRHDNFTNSSAVSYNHTNIPLTFVHEPEDIQIQLTFNTVTSGTGTFTTGSGATSGNFVTIANQSTASDSGTFTSFVWSAQKSSSQGFGVAASDTGGLFSGTALTMVLRAIDANGDVIATQTSSQDLTKGLYASATRTGFGGGGGGGGFPP
tara:strand:+ start:557 stop:1309 length:753 start_codon:yes stop_codon:yes gene_type:complete